MVMFLNRFNHKLFFLHTRHCLCVMIYMLTICYKCIYLTIILIKASASVRIFLFIAILLSAQLGKTQVPELNFTWEIKGYDSLRYDQATEFKPTDSTSHGIF